MCHLIKFLYCSLLSFIDYMHSLKSAITDNQFRSGYILLLILCGYGKDQVYKNEYEELEITYNSINEVVKPGMAIFIKTKDTSSTYILIGYEDKDTLICVNESGAVSSKTKIAIDEIERIYIRERIIKTDPYYIDRGAVPEKSNTKIFFETFAWDMLTLIGMLGLIAIAFF